MFYKDKDIFVNNNLDLKKCLLYQLKDKGIKDRNINCLDICTSCSSEYKLHSYRKNQKLWQTIFIPIFELDYTRKINFLS